MESKQTKTDRKPGYNSFEYGKRELVAPDLPLTFTDDFLTYLEGNSILEGNVYFFDNGKFSGVFNLNEEAHSGGDKYKIDIELGITARVNKLDGLVKIIQANFPQFKEKDPK